MLQWPSGGGYMSAPVHDGICLPGGVSAPVHAGICLLGGVSALMHAGIHPPVNRMTDRQV